MGGRGGALHTAPNKSERVRPDNIGPELEKSLGKQGTANTIDDARSKANPNFSYSNKKYSMNCQRCVYAYEMLRRGYNVEAKPWTGNNDPLPRGQWQQVMDQAAKNGTYISGATYLARQKEILAKMKEYGDGARCIVRVGWRRRNCGHVFIAEQVGGKTVFVDPQSGKNLPNNATGYFQQTSSTGTLLLRVDNLKPTSLLLDCVSKKNT